VTALEDTKLLFLPSDVFHKQFNSDFMLEKLKAFTKVTNINDLE